jgi:hypothetical protein
MQAFMMIYVFHFFFYFSQLMCPCPCRRMHACLFCRSEASSMGHVRANLVWWSFDRRLLDMHVM